MSQSAAWCAYRSPQTDLLEWRWYHGGIGAARNCYRSAGARAVEPRTMADQITDAEAKLAMLKVAEKYEQIARRVDSGCRLD
jgi:hypothetical protein